MSQYICFYLNYENVYCPLATYSRSNREYSYFRKVLPYGINVPITLDMLKTILQDILTDIKELKKTIKENKKEINLILNMNGISFEEKMEQINFIKEVIAEKKDSLSEVKRAKHFVEFLKNIILNIEYDNHMEAVGITVDNYLWAGIEAKNPNDIKKKEE